MANNVTTNVEFLKLSDAGKAKLQDLYSNIHPEDYKSYEWFGDLWNIDKQTSNSYNWNLENIGSKWCYFDERGDDYLRLISAWSYPQAGILWLIEQIAEADPDLLVRVVFEDEMPNFFGAAVYNKDGEVEYCEWDSDQIEELMKERMESYKDLVEGTNEYSDVYFENLWDLVHDEQSTFIDSVIYNLE